MALDLGEGRAPPLPFFAADLTNFGSVLKMNSTARIARTFDTLSTGAITTIPPEVMAPLQIQTPPRTTMSSQLDPFTSIITYPL